MVLTETSLVPVETSLPSRKLLSAARPPPFCADDVTARGGKAPETYKPSECMIVIS